MVQRSTIALSQSVVALIAIITDATMQAIAISQLNKTGQQNSAVHESKRLLWISVILQIISSLLMIGVFIICIVHREQLKAHMSKLIYASLITSGSLLLIGGGISANVAIRLQCYRQDPYINEAWKQATNSSIIGILGTISLLLMQAYIRKDNLRNIVRPRKVPSMELPAMAPQKASMPVYHPPAY